MKSFITVKFSLDSGFCQVSQKLIHIWQWEFLSPHTFIKIGETNTDSECTIGFWDQ